MPTKSSTFRLAPPTSAPSMFGCDSKRSGIVRLDAAAVLDAHLSTQPAHCTGFRSSCEGRHGPARPARAWRLCRCRSPRPARRRCTVCRHLLGRQPASEPSNCWRTTSSVRPASRSASCSPTQTIGISPAAKAAWIFLLISSFDLAEDRAPLAVAEDHVLAADVDEHRRADFAGERALRLRGTCSGAQRHRRAGECRRDGVQIDERRADGDVDVREFGRASRNAGGQRDGRRRGRGASSSCRQ